MNHKRLTFWVAAATIFSIATFASAAGSYGATNTGTINGVGPKTLVEPTKPITITYAGAAYPAKKIGHPREVAQMIVFLVSDDSSYVNASAMVVDGGLLSKCY